MLTALLNAGSSAEIAFAHAEPKWDITEERFIEYEREQAEMEILVARANQLPDLDTEPLETPYRCDLSIEQF